MIVHKDTGYIEIILGSMFSGKTTTLINIYEKALYCNIIPLVINHSFDTRYSETKMSTHDKKMIPWLNLFCYYRNSPELGIPHLMVVSAHKLLDYEPLTDYRILLDPLAAS